MEESRVGTRAMASALALALVFLEAVAADSQGEAQALFALRRRLRDPLNVLQSWDPTLVSPCTWFHVTCDSQSRVTRLDLGNARLSGTLAPELGTLTHLEYLELYKNRITGSIPKEFGNLQSLISLDLYQNNLIGTIPSSLSNLKALRFLRLNGNRLIGRIPPQLSTITSLKILDVSNNDLCGGIPTGGSFAKFSLESFRNNPRLNVASLSFALQLEDNSNSTTT